MLVLAGEQETWSTWVLIALTCAPILKSKAPTNKLTVAFSACFSSVTWLVADGDSDSRFLVWNSARISQVAQTSAFFNYHPGECVVGPGLRTSA